jgi:hypothetical protein
VDDTLRTRIAIRDDVTPPRLLIFDGGAGQVYAGRPTQLVPDRPSEQDQAILNALAAQDERGDFDRRLLVRLLLVGGSICYDVAMISVGGLLLYLKHRHRS